MADINVKEIFDKVVAYPGAPQNLEQARKRDAYGLVGAFFGAAVGAVFLSGAGAVVGAPVGLKVGHILAKGFDMNIPS
ncbi:MAG: hypothetical protein KKA05_01055 [Alphaproteobacteria bacterium]|nr:hypothetical protein [Alphaproteobacteria bacterium]MBU0860016.1 hypothetical protein [Alphaproteobacteria bacterium]